MKLEKLGTRLSVEFMVMIILMTICILAASLFGTQRILNNVTIEQARSANHSINQFIIEYEEQALIRAEMIARSDSVISAVQTKNRQTIVDALLPYTQGVDLITLCDENGIALARSHSDKFGDDVSNQFALTIALSTGKGICTVEAGTVIGLSTRGSAAIKDPEGRIIGALTVGHDLSKSEYVDRIKNMSGCEVTLFSNDERMATTLQDTAGKRMVGTKADPEVARQVIDERKEYTGVLPITSTGKNYSVCYTPFLIGDTVVGMLFAGIIVDGVQAELYSVSLMIGGAAVLVSLLMLFVVRWIIIRILVRPLNGTMASIDFSAEQVASGARHIADNTQVLTQGVSEQAAAVEEIFASINNMTATMREDIAQTKSAVELAETIYGNAETGSQQMVNMTQAVREIEEASQAITNIIKIIEDIAFQTNILALNAAVEAAHAGDAGRGFAVVAEEVRALAAKSQEAAGNTGALIKNAIAKTDLGAQIARETADSLQQIISGVRRSNQVINEIAASSIRQGEAIEHISKGVEMVNHVVQQNMSTTEDTAASAQEMDGLAGILHDMIAEFALSEQDLVRAAQTASSGRPQEAMASQSKKPRALPRGRSAE